MATEINEKMMIFFFLILLSFWNSCLLVVESVINNPNKMPHIELKSICMLINFIWHYKT